MRGPHPLCACALITAVLFVLATESAARAQSAYNRATVLQNAPIMLLPDTTRVPLRVAAKGTSLVVLAEEADWVQVQFQDPQFGLRVGYVQRQFVSIQRPAMQPVDLSVTSPPASTASPALPQPVGAPATQSPQRDLPSPVSRGLPNRVFIDLNWMNLHPSQKVQTFTLTTIQFQEPATAQATYPDLPSVNGWDVSGGVLLGGQWAVGVRALLAEFQLPVALGVRVPHPTFFNRLATDVDVTNGVLLREEKIFDFHAMFSHNTPRWRIVGFGGPTYFRLSHQMVGTVRYAQLFNVITGSNVVNITTYDQADVFGSTWGLNTGVDASLFFSRFVGVGGGVRFNYGTVGITDPLSGAEAELRVGSTTFVAGPRFRF